MASVDPTAVLNNPQVFEALVEQLLSADNEARKQAEVVFDQCKQQPDACVMNLLRCLRECQQEERRSFCAIMLRKVLTQQEPNLWSTSSPSSQANIKTELLNALLSEQQRSVLFKVCDTVSELGADLLPKGSWPELLPGLQQLAAAPEPRHVEAALAVLSSLAAYCIDALRPLLGPLQQLLGTCLGHAQLRVQVAALKAAASVINSLEESREREPWSPLLGPMLAALGRCLAGDEEAAQDVLEALIELADQHPKFLRGHLADVVNAMLQIATAAQLEPATRVLASEVLVTLCEARDKAPGMMRKLPAFVGQLFGALMGFLLDVEDEESWHAGDSDAHDEDGNGELFDDGQEALDRVAIALGGKALVPAAAQLLPVWLGDGADWRKRHAALICLAQIAEGCAKVMSESMGELVGMCLTGLRDPHPKVRWAACQALGQMCTDLGPDLQEAHATTILPALMAAMEDFSAPRVQAHASAAVVNFSEGCEPDLMAPYLDTLISQLVALLQRGKKLVQEGALTALASVADCAQEAFVKYYDAVMPLLSTLLLNAQDKQYRLLRAKALECVSLVGMAVGKERFRGAAADVMAYLAQLQAAGLEADDPTSSYMLQAGARLCKCLGAEFLPYLGVVMPPLLEAAGRQVDVSLTEGDVADLEEADDDDVEHIQLGDKVLSIRTSLMEEKATAANMICCYVEELKGGFWPYVTQVTDIMLPLLKFYFHEEVRRAAVQCLPHLVRCAQAAAEAGAAGASAGAAGALLGAVWDPLIGALKKEPDTEVQASMLDALGDLVELAEPGSLSTPAVEGAFTCFRGILAAAEARRTKRQQRVAQEDFDEEEAEALEAENEAEEELFDQVGNCLGVFLRKFGDAALPYVEGLMPTIAPLLNKARPAEERRIALCIIDDMLEHSPAARAKYTPQLINVLLDECMSDHEDLRQCAVYGLGVVAALSPDLVKPHAPAAQQRVLAILQHPQARSEDNEMATDNAVAALGALLEHHSDVLDGGALGEAWVGALPIKADKVEAVKVHEQLLRLVEAQDPRVLGPGGKHLPHIAGVVVQVLGKGTDLIGEATLPRLVALGHALKAQLPGPTEAAVAGLNDKQRAKYMQLMGGAA